MQRMTTQQAAKASQATAPNAIAFDGFRRIIRTRRGKSAGGRQPRRDDLLIRPYDSACRSAPDGSIHVVAPRSDNNSDRNSAKSLSYTDRRGFTTISKPPGITCQDE